MATAAQSVRINVEADVEPAKRQVRRLINVAREANAELARLLESLTALERRLQRLDEAEAKLAEYGIKLEVE